MEAFSKDLFESVEAWITSSGEEKVMSIMGGRVGGGWCWSDRELGIAFSGSGGQDSHGKQRPWLGCNCRCVSLWDGSRCTAPG